ncbi:MAG: tRNA (N6-isopentenyl adenosine(37)-C2)-methylthiotransferase MiaB [Deltaproteobacteria bacterium]|jgi:tRNA-2-methylthio-N6-dimethylallyladenosine synthase|nr:tRNA (N6-isopentenyl adenosine(37)-C2)-methylthiotransferase MiaB [Deltaproteobacteria bacterium]
MRKVFIKTFGCQMNAYDSEKILTLLQHSYRSVPDYQAADLVIINTCSVREKAEKKLYDLLGRLAVLKKLKTDLVVGVAGCVAQQEGEKILKRSSIVNFVVGTHHISLIPALVREAENGKAKSVVIDYQADWELPISDELSQTALENYVDFSNTQTFGNYYSKVRALVAIQRGCNKHCSYCVVPTTRGVELSRDPREVEREIKFKIQHGASEVMLLGQTVNSYGKGLAGRGGVTFENLVRRIAEIDGVKRIRFMSPHPQDVTQDFVKLYAEVPQLCPSIHLPLQAGSNRILRLMNRNYKVERYLEIVAMLHEVRPDLALTSDFIVAFPTETDEEFEETLSVMRKLEYSFSFSFKYSSRPNTLAQAKFGNPDLIPQAIAKNRLERVQELQKELSLKYNSKFLGQKMQILVENITNGVVRGRSPHNVLVEIIDNLIVTSLKVGDEIEVVGESCSPFVIKGTILN